MKRILFFVFALIQVTLCICAQSVVSNTLSASDNVTILLEHAKYLSLQGKYDDAINYCTVALRVLKNANDTIEEKDSYYALVLNCIARCNYEKGNYDEALSRGYEALKYLDSRPEGSYYVYGVTLTNLTEFNLTKANFSEAIKLGERARYYKAKYNGKNNTSYVAILNILTSCYIEIREFEKALSLTDEAHHILESTPEIDRSLMVIVLNNMAVINKETNNYDEALQYGNKALQLLNTFPDDIIPKYALTLGNIIDINMQKGYWEEAVRIGNRILDIMRKAPNKDHYNFTRILFINAFLNLYRGNFDEALKLGEEALQIRKMFLGENHRDYGFSLLQMAYFYYNIGNVSLLENFAVSFYNRYSNYIQNTFKDLTEYQRNQFWELNQEPYQIWAHRFSYKYPTENLIKWGYNASLLNKGLLLNLSRSMSELIQSSGDLEALALYEDLRHIRVTLHNQYEKPIAERVINTDSLEAQITDMERELINKSKVYGNYLKDMSIQWEDVQKKLSPKDVCIEFVSFPLNEDSIMYVAYVLQKGMSHPELVPLLDEKSLIENNKRDSLSVSSLIWKPLSKFMDGRKNVYFAPSGELYNIPIETLPLYWNGDSLMTDKWNMYRLSSTRELAVEKSKRKYRKAALYGGIMYDTEIDFLRNDSVRFPSIESLETILLGEREPIYANELPETKKEVEEINKILIQKNIKTTLKTDTLATEGDFKYLSGEKNNLLHIATHGYYLPEEKAKKHNQTDYTKIISLLPQYVEDDALNRSALLFAGVNNVLRGDSLPENVNDGFLTAREISQLDLRGLDLAVLSACETGRGDITAEGVFGLQRGFKKAGAKSILMSLWEVDDKATQLLMVQFYKNLLSGLSKYESLKNAQKYLREEYEEDAEQSVITGSILYNLPKGRRDKVQKKVTEKKKIYKDPHFWAAFVLLDGID